MLRFCIALLRFHEKNHENSKHLKKFVKTQRFCFTFLLLNSISRKNYENSKQIKIRENATVLIYSTIIHFDFTQKLRKFKASKNS